MVTLSFFGACLAIIYYVLSAVQVFEVLAKQSRHMLCPRAYSLRGRGGSEIIMARNGDVCSKGKVQGV